MPIGGLFATWEVISFCVEADAEEAFAGGDVEEVGILAAAKGDVCGDIGGRGERQVIYGVIGGDETEFLAIRIADG